MCYEPRGLWVVEVTAEEKVKMIVLDEDTKITNMCLNHDVSSRSKDVTPSSIKLISNGYEGTICTLTPTKTEQALVDILLPKGAKVSIELIGEGSVFVAGYCVQSVCIGARDSEASRPSPDLKARKKLPPPPSVPSKRSTPESLPDSNPRRRPTPGFKRADPNQGQLRYPPSNDECKTSATPTPLPPPRTTLNQQVPPPRFQPAAEPVVKNPIAFETPALHFQFRATVPPKDAATNINQPPEQGQAPMPQTLPVDNPQSWRVVSKNRRGDSYAVEITDRQVGQGPIVNEDSLVTFDYAVRNPHTKGTTYNGRLAEVHISATKSMVPGIHLGLGGMRVGGSRRIALPAISRVDWDTLVGIPDDAGHIIELKLSESK